MSHPEGEKIIRKITDSSTCEYDGCDCKATQIVYSRNLDAVILCCESHGEVVVDEQSPEYWDQCKNCGCHKGVN